MTEESFATPMMAALWAAGLGQAVFIFESPPERKSFGNALAFFGLGSMLLKFIRDRGQIFMEIAASIKPEQYYSIYDIEIAMGWRTFEEFSEPFEPEQIGDVLARFARFFDQLNIAFSGDAERVTAEKIERVRRDKREAVIRKLQGGQLH